MASSELEAWEYEYKYENERAQYEFKCESELGCECGWALVCARVRFLEIDKFRKSVSLLAELRGAKVFRTWRVFEEALFDHYVRSILVSRIRFDVGPIGMAGGFSGENLIVL